MTSMLRSNLIVASGTALSRLTGLLRIVVLAYVLGQTALADAYKLSNETPNIVYDLLIGGVLSATLVPLFSTFVEEEDDESTNVVLKQPHRRQRYGAISADWLAPDRRVGVRARANRVGGRLQAEQ